MILGVVEKALEKKIENPEQINLFGNQKKSLLIIIFEIYSSTFIA